MHELHSQYSPLQIKIAEAGAGLEHGWMFGADPLGALYSRFVAYETLGARGLRGHDPIIKKDVPADLDSRTYRISKEVGITVGFLWQIGTLGVLQLVYGICNYVGYRKRPKNLD